MTNKYYSKEKSRDYRARKIAENPRFFADQYQAWLKDPAAKKKKAKTARSYLIKNPERKAAIDLAQRHVPLGKKCEICGATTNLQRHHDDYSKPLEVRTLCKICHEKYHITHKPKTRKDNITLVCSHCGAKKKVNMIPVRGRFRCIICLKITVVNNKTQCDSCSNFTSKDSKPYCAGYSYFFRTNFKKRRFHCVKYNAINANHPIKEAEKK